MSDKINEKSRISCPILPRVPGIAGDPLVIRVSHTGATLLKDGAYRTRFTGGDAVVDINGKLHLSKKDYRKQLAKEMEGRESKKKSRRATERENMNHSRGSEDTKISVLQKKTYRVNKTEVINRIAAMTNALYAWQKSGAFLGMLTVTFPPEVTEALAMQALNTWLTAMRQKGTKMIRQYLWVAERQSGDHLEDKSKATNTIHFHMLICNRINIVKANRAMRVVLCNLIRSGSLKYNIHKMKRYNGVDLAKNRQTRVVTNFMDHKSRQALSFYVTKYVTKNNEGFEGAAWGCSRGFSAIFTAITCTYNEFIRMCWHDQAWQEPAIENEWFEFYPWYGKPPPEIVNTLAKLNLWVLVNKGVLN